MAKRPLLNGLLIALIVLPNLVLRVVTRVTHPHMIAVIAETATNHIDVPSTIMFHAMGVPYVAEIPVMGFTGMNLPGTMTPMHPDALVHVDVVMTHHLLLALTNVQRHVTDHAIETSP